MISVMAKVGDVLRRIGAEVAYWENKSITKEAGPEPEEKPHIEMKEVPKPEETEQDTTVTTPVAEPDATDDTINVVPLGASALRTRRLSRQTQLTSQKMKAHVKEEAKFVESRSDESCSSPEEASSGGSIYAYKPPTIEAKVKVDNECMKKYQSEGGAFKGGKGEKFDNCVKGFSSCATGVKTPERLCAYLGREHGKISNIKVASSEEAVKIASMAAENAYEYAIALGEHKIIAKTFADIVGNEVFEVTNPKG